MLFWVYYIKLVLTAEYMYCVLTVKLYWHCKHKYKSVCVFKSYIIYYWIYWLQRSNTLTGVGALKNWVEGLAAVLYFLNKPNISLSKIYNLAYKKKCCSKWKVKLNLSKVIGGHFLTISNPLLVVCRCS